MIDHLRKSAGALAIVWALTSLAAAVAHSTPAAAQAPADAASATPAAASQAAPAAAAPQINKAEITARANGEAGLDMQAVIAAWQRDLDRFEAELRDRKLRYSELNEFRDELQRVRSEAEDL